MIKDVPDYQWYHGCSPTASANLVGYWSQYYNNLLGDNETTKQLIDNLAKMMGTAKDDSTSISNMAPGFKKYWKSRGYDVESENYTKPTFEKYKKEIDSDRPMLVNTQDDLIFGNHTMTGVGYIHSYIPELNETYRAITVHDTWKSTPEDVTIDFDNLANSISSFVTVNPSNINQKLFNFKRKQSKSNITGGVVDL